MHEHSELLSQDDAAELAGLRYNDIPWMVLRARFPRPLQRLGADKRPVWNFYLSEVEAWIRARIAERDS
jgi:predicted DNA-binding transcriptional regulator AlpA